MSDLAPYLALLHQRRYRLQAGALLMLLTVLSAVGLLSLSGWFITATGVTAALWAAGTSVAFDVYVPGGGIRFFALGRTVSRYLERLYNHDTVLRLLADLRGGLFAALLRLDAGSLGRLRSGAVLNRLTADIDALDGLYLRLLAPPVVAVVSSLVVALLVGWFLPWSAALVAAWMLGAILAGCLLGAWRGRAPGGRLGAWQERMRVALADHLRGLAERLAFGTLDRHRHAIDTTDHRLMSDQRRLARQAALGQALSLLAVHALAVTVLLMAVPAYRDGRITAAVMVLLPLAVMALAEALTPVPGAFTQLGATRAAARRVSAQARQRRAVAWPREPAPAPASASLVLHGVTRRHPTLGHPVLNELSVALATGERLAVVGESGCGKSTLADLIARLADPDNGTVSIGGTDLRRVAPDTLRTTVGYLTQRTDLFDDSVAANLRIAAPQASDSSLWRALAVVGLDERVAALPRGLGAPVGESGHRLSGGEGRRLALARVVLRDTPVVVLDEPFTGLDRNTLQRVSAGVERWLEGRTALLLAHDAASLPAAERVARLCGGRLVA